MKGLFDAYCAAWNQDDAVRRHEMLTTVCHPEVVYVDPRIRTVGVAELVTFIGEVRSRRAGARVTLTSGLDAHHGIVRFSWQVILSDGSTLPESFDVCDVDDGRLVRIVGFFGALPPLEGAE